MEDAVPPGGRDAAKDLSALLQNANTKSSTPNSNPSSKNWTPLWVRRLQGVVPAESSLSGDSVQAYRLGEALREVEGAAYRKILVPRA